MQFEPSDKSSRSIDKANKSEVSVKNETARGPISRYIYLAIDKLMSMVDSDNPASCCIYIIVAFYYIPLVFILIGEVLVFALLILVISIPDAACFHQVGTTELTQWYWCTNSFVRDDAMGYGFFAGPTWSAMKPMVQVISRGPVPLAISFFLPVFLLGIFWFFILIVDFLISGVVLLPMVMLSIFALLLTCPCMFLDAVVQFHISFVNKIIKFVNFYWRLNIAFRKSKKSPDAIPV